ncbi:MAG: hypothetical protein ACOX52_23095 [Verrucomicrobiota bacterium]|jgi:hypothetical protein
MSADIHSAVRIVSLVLLLPLLCLVSEAEPKPQPPEEDALQPVQNDNLLEILGKAEKASAKGKVLEEFQKHPKAQRLATLAYALKERKHTQAALQVIIDNQDMKDRRLTPFLAKTMETAEGKDLMLCARVAKHVPDPVLLRPLIERALDSEYVEVKRAGGAGGSIEFSYHSAFAEAAEAIYCITDGKIGSEKIRRDKPTSKEEKDILIQKWKKAWAEIQEEKETSVPPPQ